MSEQLTRWLSLLVSCTWAADGKAMAELQLRTAVAQPPSSRLNWNHVALSILYCWLRYTLAALEFGGDRRPADSTTTSDASWVKSISSVKGM